MSLIAGSYDRFIWGYKLKVSSRTQALTLTPLFSFPSHLSPIKSVSLSGTVAASGGADDTIKIYDLSSSSEVGSLHHTTTLTSLAFFTPPSRSFPRNLIAGDDEGSVVLYDSDPFLHLKTLRVHRKAVNAIAVHPSGRLALSAGRDACLAMVNLVRGRKSFYCSLGKEAGIVGYCENGESFYLGIGEKVSVHHSEDAKIQVEFESTKPVLCAASSEVMLATLLCEIVLAC